MTRALALVVALVAARALAADPPVHHVLELRLDPTARTVHGVDRVTLRAGAPAAFALASGFTIERLTVDGAAVKPAATDGRVSLGLDERPVHEIVVEYRGTLAAPPREGDPTGPVAGPEGSYLPSSSGWYPTFEGPFTYAVTIEVPDPQRAVTSGRLTAETSADGRYRVTFTTDTPAVELSLFAGPYRIAERIHRSWRLRTYFEAGIANLADTYLDRVQGYLDLYDGWIGAYPYAGFSVVSSPFPVGLGFPGITYLGSQVLRLPFIPDTSLGHEVLHSWWGTGVRPGADGNWAEGLTTFMADYTFLEARGPRPAREERLAWLREFAILPRAEDRPLTSFQGRSHAASQATGYHKAAFVFIMLRNEIGPEAFTSGVQRFWQAHRFSEAGWGDLETAFAQAASLPLSRFFEQWIRRAGAPALALRDARSEGARVTFSLEQGDPPYSLSVPVTVDTDASPVARTVQFEDTTRAFAFDVATGTPRTLAVDPDFRLFRRLAPGEIPPLIRGVAFDAGASTLLAARDDAGRAAAREVATQLFGRAPTIVAAGAPAPPGPLLVVGTTAEVAALLATAGLDGTPAALEDKGTARVWAARRPDGAPLVVVAGTDATALRAAARPLPHYGRQSFVVFEGARAADRGLWPPAASPLRAELVPPGAAGMPR